MLFSVAEQNSTVLIFQSLFIQPPAERYLGYFQLLTIKNRTAMNFAMSLYEHMFLFLLVKYLKSGNGGSYGKRMFVFVKNHEAVFQSNCTVFHSH